MQRYSVYGRFVPLSENGIPLDTLTSGLTPIPETLHDVFFADDVETRLVELGQMIKSAQDNIDRLMQQRTDLQKALRDIAGAWLGMGYGADEMKRIADAVLASTEDC